MRHKGTSVVIASQNPPSVPREVIELCSVVVAHKFTSPQWLEHVRKVNEAFGRDLGPPQLAALAPGEAFVWSREGAERAETTTACENATAAQQTRRWNPTRRR